MVKDVDGFELFFEKNTSSKDKKFFSTKYPNVDIVKNERVHCTTCDYHIGTAPISKKNLQTHPLLGVTQCNKCLYKKCDSNKGDDGYEYYCRWCGYGGKLLCCSKCSCVFCKTCIRTNFTAADLEKFEKDDNWACFSCDKETLKDFRARHWALQNFIKKQEENINQTYFRSDDELNMALSRDISTCCSQETKTAKRLTPAKRKVGASPLSQTNRASFSPQTSVTETSVKIQCTALPVQEVKCPLRVELSQRPQRPSSPKKASTIGARRATMHAPNETFVDPPKISQKKVSFAIASSEQGSFFETAKTECDEIIAVMKICQHTINEMNTLTKLTNPMTPETTAKLSELCISLQYLQTYSAGLMKTHQVNLSKEWGKNDQN